jgi:outer membrane lipoprotein carrier protein
MVEPWHTKLFNKKNKKMFVQKKSISLFIFLILGWHIPSWAINIEQNTVKEIQKTYKSVLTFQATFEQKAFVKMLNRTEITRGYVQIKKPGKMKWTYNSPDPQILISNQKNLWLYTPEDEQATKMPIENVYSSNTPALFLAGQAILTDIFDVVKVLAKNDEFVVVFTPKEVESNLSRLVLRANKNNYQITGATVYDKLDNKTDIKFRTIRTNEEIPESVFNFEVPPGVEVQDFTPSPKK